MGGFPNEGNEPFIGPLPVAIAELSPELLVLRAELSTELPLSNITNLRVSSLVQCEKPLREKGNFPFPKSES